MPYLNRERISRHGLCSLKILMTRGILRLASIFKFMIPSSRTLVNIDHGTTSGCAEAGHHLVRRAYDIRDLELDLPELPCPERSILHHRRLSDQRVGVQFTRRELEGSHNHVGPKRESISASCIRQAIRKIHV